MKKWRLVIDVEKCENCNNCFLSCKDEFVDNQFDGYSLPQPKHGHRWMNISPRERGTFPMIDVAYLPAPCFHCEDPACIQKSQDGSVYRRPDGIVMIDPVKAKGKREIVNSCPYSHIWWNEEMNLAQKCTLCAHLLDNGWTETRCVNACPTGALKLENLERNDNTTESKDLERYMVRNESTPIVQYKNLYRYTRCFIAGTVEAEIAGKIECLEGATVKLTQKGDPSTIDSVITDSFGDFKFDRLTPNSGDYTLKIAHPDYPPRASSVSLKYSQFIGTIRLEKS